jgi:hypothetical protein
LSKRNRGANAKPKPYRITTTTTIIIKKSTYRTMPAAGKTTETPEEMPQRRSHSHQESRCRQTAR